jgi:hypothetical protein
MNNEHHRGRGRHQSLGRWSALTRRPWGPGRFVSMAPTYARASDAPRNSRGPSAFAGVGAQRTSAAAWRRALPAALALGLAALLPGQGEPKPTPPEDAAAARAALLKTFADAGITVDLERGSVTIDAVAARRTDLLEYVIGHRRGKLHESMFITDVQPSLLNAALLAVGMTPGKNADYREKDPLPTEEEVRNGVDPIIVIPPAGTPIWMTVTFADAEGAQVELPVEDLLMDIATEAPVEDVEWIYIGGRTVPPYRGEPPVFIADLEGNLVSTCYLMPENHLVTIKHERGRSDQNWWFTDRCPQAGTEVKFSFHRQRPPVSAAREERIAKDRAAGKKPEVKHGDRPLPAPPAGEGGAPPPREKKDG